MSSPSREHLPYRFQIWMDGSSKWLTCARFLSEVDALEYARRDTARHRRVMLRRNSIASYSGEYIPPSERDSVGPDGPVTEAPEH